MDDAVEAARRILNADADHIDARDAIEVADALLSSRSEVDRLREALEPSGDTKAAYSGEFRFSITEMVEDDDGEGDAIEVSRDITVPWTAIKEIMAAIKARATLSPPKGDAT